MNASSGRALLDARRPGSYDALLARLWVAKVGFGRVVASEIIAPNMLGDMA